MRVKAIHVTAVLFTLLGLFVVWECRKLPYWSEFGPGAGFMPLWIGILLALLSMALVIQLLRLKDEGVPQRVFLTGWKDSRRVWLIILGWCSMGLLIRWLGFHLPSVLFVFFAVGFVERKPWWVALTVAVLTVLSFYLIFDVLLNSDLPRGVLWQ